MKDELVIEFQLGNAAKVLLKHSRLDFQLMPVVGVLIVATATAAKVRAMRLDAMRRGLENLIGSGARKAGFIFEQGRFNFFALQHKRQEYRFTAALRIGRKASQAVAPINQFFDGKLQEMILEGFTKTALNACENHSFGSKNPASRR